MGWSSTVLAPVAAPAYVALEGLALGAVSHTYEVVSGGIVLQAIGATVAVLLIQLVLFASGLVRATPRSLEALFAAGLATILLYAIVLTADAVGFSATFLDTDSHVVVSLVSAGVAAFFLFADFHVIEEGARDRAPQDMEWYAALGLVLTLVWLIGAARTHGRRGRRRRLIPRNAGPACPRMEVMARCPSPHRR